MGSSRFNFGQAFHPNVGVSRNTAVEQHSQFRSGLVHGGVLTQSKVSFQERTNVVQVASNSDEFHSTGQVSWPTTPCHVANAVAHIFLVVNHVLPKDR